MGHSRATMRAAKARPEHVSDTHAARNAPSGNTPANEGAGVQAAPASKRYLILATVVAGFGLCRAWIVSCLSVSFSQNVPEASLIFLIMGALAAAFVAFAAHKAIGKSERFREHIAESALILGIMAALITPAAFAVHSPLLALAAFMMGGVAAGLLQILWGERFVAFSHKFVIAASGGSAIATALCLIVLPLPLRLLCCTALPIISCALLIVACQFDGTSWRTGLPLDPEELEAFLVAQEALAAKQALEESTAEASADYAENKTGKRGFSRMAAKLMASIAIFRLPDAHA